MPACRMIRIWSLRSANAYDKSYVDKFVKNMVAIALSIIDRWDIDSVAESSEACNDASAPALVRCRVGVMHN